MMPTDRESNEIKKAMAYDLLQIIKTDAEKTFTQQELEALIAAYIRGLEQ